jgi:hypothetical protein
MTTSDPAAPRTRDVTTDLKGQIMNTDRKKLGKGKAWVLGLTVAPMLAVGIFGGVGSFHNLTGAYGSGTAMGAVAAGEGATAVLALLYVVTTLLGQVASRAIRMGLYALPASAAAMAATAATGPGQTIVYALTPMAITAAAEGLAFLVRRAVVYTDGRDAEAEARASRIIRDLNFHQSRSIAHPDEKIRAKSEKRKWKLAAKVGAGDVSLGTALLDVQHTRIVQGADVALQQIFQPYADTAAPGLALPAASASTAPALLPASAGDATAPRDRDTTVQAETSGYPAQTAPEQAGEARNDRPALALVPMKKDKKPSISSDVRQMVKDGVSDVRHVVDAIATRHGRAADDPTLRQTVGRYYRQAKAAGEAEDRTTSGQYL